VTTKPFIHDDFMLDTPQARRLYHEAAEALPIIDYHCHLPPAEVAGDKRWENLAQIWLYGDHYKWRAMRSNGIAERYCTGDATDREKFDRFAATMPYLLRNPMYHWSQLELKRYFDVDTLLSPDTADAVWEQTRERLRDPAMSARGLMKQSRVALVCTTDDPVDSLEHHRAVAGDASFDIAMLPAWRPDKAMTVRDPAAFNAWTDRLAAAADTDIGSFRDFLAALEKRHGLFHEHGCRLSDHGIETVYPETCTETEAAAVFDALRAGRAPAPARERAFQTLMLTWFGELDASRDWTQQFHYGALRNNNTRMFGELGPDTGFDSIGDWPVAEGLSRLLDRLDSAGTLPRTILYTLNPRDNELLGAMLGNFQGPETAGKIQFGSGWWFNDHIDGMRRQMDALSALGLLRRFVGMLTDSRSFLSYTRHEYFRRVLCNLLGDDMARGLIPDDMALVGAMVRDICYNNAARYFGFDVPAAGTE